MSIQQFVYLHKEHQDWLQQLDLCQDEIKFFQHSLGRLAATDQDKAPTSKIEEYRQDCINSLQQIDLLRHQVYRNEAEVAKRLELADRLKQHVVPEEIHERLHQMIETFLLEFKAFKKNLTAFLLEKGKR